MKRAIVTGASGFLGSYLVRELIHTGWKVTAVVRNEKKAREVFQNQPGVRLVICEQADYGALVECPELRDAELLFHFSWEGVSGELAAHHPTQLRNVKCACDLQEAAAELGVKRFIFAGSIMEYEYEKASEAGMVHLPLRDTYHIAKIAARRLLQLKCAGTNMDFIPLIISNVYGVGERSERFINTAVRNLLQGKRMRFTSGEQLYDFIYVTDAVRAIRLAGERGKAWKAYYIGNREQRPLRDFLLDVRDVVAPQMELGLGEMAYSGVALSYREFSTCGLYEDFDFEPEIDFRRGIRMTAEWMRGARDAI